MSKIYHWTSKIPDFWPNYGFKKVLGLEFHCIPHVELRMVCMSIARYHYEYDPLTSCKNLFSRSGKPVL